MRVRRMKDGYMHRRMQKNKHMQGNDLGTPTLPIKEQSLLNNP